MTTAPRPRSTLVALVLAGGLVLGACSGDDGTPASGPDTGAEPDGPDGPPATLASRGSCDAAENDTTLLDPPTDPADPDETHEVGTTTLELTDPDRDRTLTVRARFPEGVDTALPVVVVSHTGGGESAQNALGDLGDALAAQGYLVLNPNHTSEGGRIDRTPDVSFLIDSIEDGDLDLPDTTGEPDAGRVASVGHGQGASTAMELAGATSTFGDDVRCLADDRLGAFVALSPSGPGEFGLAADSWAGMRGPFYLVAGEADLDRGPAEGESVEGWRRAAFDEMRPGHAYLSVLPDVEQRDFAVAEDEQAADAQAFVAANVLAFLDTYLRGVDRAEEIGTAGDLTGVTNEQR